MFCTRCGSANLDQARFCSSCGSAIGPDGFTGAAPQTAYVATTQFRYAGFWRRFVAMIIDGLVFSPLFIICAVATGLFGAVLSPGAGRDEVLGAMFGVGIFLFVIAALAGSWLYHTLMESSRYQGTLGKMALGIRVTDLNGARISFARANGRFFGKWISGAIMNIGYLMAAFTERKQALHDILAGCLVILK